MFGLVKTSQANETLDFLLSDRGSAGNLCFFLSFFFFFCYFLHQKVKFLVEFSSTSVFTSLPRRLFWDQIVCSIAGLCKVYIVQWEFVIIWNKAEL